MEKELSELLKEYVAASDDQKLLIRAKITKLLNFDELNSFYFIGLYSKYAASKSAKRTLVLKEQGRSLKDGEVQAVPTAIATKEEIAHIPVTYYEDLINSPTTHTKKANLWIKKMQAGTGSSIKRDKYLGKVFNVVPKAVKIGAKGTDLFVTINKQRLSIAELQILQAVSDQKNSQYGRITLHDIVSSETEESIEEIWNRPNFLEPKTTYRDYFTKNKDLSYFGQSFQYHIPTIDDNKRVSYDRIAPGGHALFGVDALMAAYRPTMRPKTDLTLISSIGNGEDLSSGPDQYMVNWMVEKQIPIAMVTTTKTAIDLKGGQIAVVLNDQGENYVTMIEKAQAEESGQIKYFEQLGLRPNDNKAFFNTNMVLINYAVLSPMIEKLIKEIGEAKFLDLIMPDLIENKKKQKDCDGVERVYTQLEGAMGSVMLNLDRFWRKHYGKPIVHFLNVDVENRTKFFSPIKTSFDFFMQFYSDRFELDINTFRLINKRPKSIPHVEIKPDLYKEVQEVLDAFDGASLIDMDSLEVSGICNFKGAKIVGHCKA